VCTLIEESETLQCQAATETASELEAALPGMRIGLIHGRLPTVERDAVMRRFEQADLDLLVATSVIEVGVDVPNARLMIIENAERLGLAQLHQMRGRVGRGAGKSACVLLYRAPLSAAARARLRAVRETNDGFAIAARDLELRGPGEVLGTRQTGLLSLRIADLVRDQAMLPAVQRCASKMLRLHRDRVDPLIERWVGGAVDYAEV
jgi:ATP-dependent DNA helicase RecG